MQKPRLEVQTLHKSVASHTPHFWRSHAQFLHTRAHLAPWLPPAYAAGTQVLLRLLKQVTANSLGIEVDKPTLDYVAQLATLLFNSQNREPAAWQDAVVPYLAPFFGDEGAEGVCSACLGRCVGWTHTCPMCGVPQTSSLSLFPISTWSSADAYLVLFTFCSPKTLLPPLQNPTQGQPADRCTRGH